VGEFLEDAMKLRSVRSLLTFAVLFSTIAACGGDDIAPPEVDGGGTDSGSMDAGGTDAGPRDAGDVDASALDAALGDGGGDATVCPDEDSDGHGASPCGDDCDDAVATTFPGSPETCNGADDDCDGTIDNDVPTGDACSSGTGACAASGTLLCVDGTYSACSASAGSPTTEVCNGIDDDCDGAVDNAVPVGAVCTNGIGACAVSGTLSCAAGTYSVCDAVAGSPTTETCNGIDDDCDGITDNGVPTGGACTAGVGACAGTGTLSCAAGSYSSCSAVAGSAVTETCNGIDDDCDGITDNGVPTGGACAAGLGACMTSGTLSCAAGTYSVCSAVAGSPTTETCNGIDDDCDGFTDNGVPTGGACTAGVGACAVSGTLLCVDGTYSTCSAIAGSPATEVCNSIDDDCDGTNNEGFLDTDADGLADCVDPDDDDDGAPDVMDCAPLNPAVFRGATEVCNGIDDDCDAAVDEGFLDTDSDGRANCVDPDDDGDGDPDVTDCAPLNPAVFRGATEVCNSIDDDCDGTNNEGFVDTDTDGRADCVDPDDDGDGDPDVSDCAPLNPAVFRGAAEVCNSIDDDCDGTNNEGFVDTDTDGRADCVDPDDDGDGDPDVTDCAPLNPAVFHGATEVCNGIDDDCDGTIDNGVLTTYYRDGDGDGFGVANPTAQACSLPVGYATDASDCDDGRGATYPGATETSNLIDDDCDGTADNGAEFADCLAILSFSATAPDGVYRIDPDGIGGALPFDVRCDMTSDGGGWTVVQRRYDGSVPFDSRAYVDYVTGFGVPSGEYWIGLERWRLLTSAIGRTLTLRVELTPAVAPTAMRFGRWEGNAIGPESEGYALSVGAFTDGGIGDSLTYHNGRPFSSIDHDVDAAGMNCAAAMLGGWWYGACHLSGLNGRYLPGAHASYGDGIDWSSFRGYNEGMASSVMMVR
jgi:hypothetical protein